jgi:hypothetical protein
MADISVYDIYSHEHIQIIKIEYAKFIRILSDRGKRRANSKQTLMFAQKCSKITGLPIEDVAEIIKTIITELQIEKDNQIKQLLKSQENTNISSIKSMMSFYLDHNVVNDNDKGFVDPGSYSKSNSQLLNVIQKQTNDKEMVIEDDQL